ncbi:LysE family transporter [Cellulosimicrobium sp. PMB13]|uniref:LysE family transporter n=1 Tax=Cellulosimicrobium sp. PMB13 TaxID=3120158 RepID=UPI003F4B29FC
MTDALPSLWAGVLAGYAIAVPVGAIATYLVALTARTSWRVGAAAGLGIATADGLYALVATLGGVALAGVIAPVAPWLRVASGVVLVALALRTAWVAVHEYRAHAVPVDLPVDLPVRPPVGSPVDVPAVVSGRRRTRLAGPSPGPGRAYVQLLALTVVNPATVAYFATVVVGARAAAGDAAVVSGALFVVGAFAASASWQLLLAGGGTVLGRRLSGPRGRLATGLVSAAVMLLLVVVLVV